MSKLVEAAEASRILAKLVEERILGYEEVHVGAATGRTSAEAVLASHCSPKTPLALLDGCAVDSGKVSEGSVLAVEARLRPGDEPVELRDREKGCVWVDTGAPMPRGTDAVVPVEELEVYDGGARVKVLSKPSRFRGVAAPCSDVASRDALLWSNEEVTIWAATALMSRGVARVRVKRLPKACIAAVGDELAELGECGGNKICEVNRFYVSKALEGIGVKALDLGILPDDTRIIEDTISRAASEGCHLVLISGGSSVGLSDYTARVPARTLIRGVNLRPGRPTKIMDLGGPILVVLPGHPRSAASAVEEVVVPALKGGRGGCTVEAIALAGVKSGARRVKQPVSLIKCREGYAAVPVSLESYMTYSWALADAEIVLEPGSQVEPGQKVLAVKVREPVGKVLDLADSEIVSLGGIRTLKVGLDLREEVLSSLHLCPGSSAILEDHDLNALNGRYESYSNLTVRKVYLVSRRGRCNSAATPNLASAIKAAEEAGVRVSWALPRVESAIELWRLGYIDCFIAPLSEQAVSSLARLGARIDELDVEAKLLLVKI